jgi:hypothetical protein
LDERRCNLKKAGKPPAPVARDSKCAISCPCCYDAAKIPTCVEDSSNFTSLLGVAEFGDEKRRSDCADAGSMANKESARNEHPNILGTRLQSSSESNITAANEDRSLAADPIAEIWCVWQAADSSDRLNGVKETERGSLRILEVCTDEHFFLGALYC